MDPIHLSASYCWRQLRGLVASDHSFHSPSIDKRYPFSDHAHGMVALEAVKQGNGVVFDNKTANPFGLLSTNQAEARHWAMSGAAWLAAFIPAVPSTYDVVLYL